MTRYHDDFEDVKLMHQQPWSLRIDTIKKNRDHMTKKSNYGHMHRTHI